MYREKRKKGIKRYYFYIVLLDQTVSVALYNLTLAGDSPNLGVSHHLEVIRADGQFTSHAGLAPSICPPYVFASPNFTPWYGRASQ